MPEPLASPFALGRRRFVREIVRGPFAKAVGGVITLLGTIATVRECAVPEATQAKLNFYRVWTLDWPWYLWVIVLLVAVAAILFEGAFRMVRDRDRELQQHTAVRFPVLVATAHAETFIDKAWTPTSARPETFEERGHTYLRLLITNDTLLATDASIARDLVVGIDYLAPDRADLRGMEGRWVNARLGERHSTPPHRTTLSVGEARAVDIAFRRHTGNVFAFSVGSSDDPPMDSRPHLGNGPYEAMVRVRGPHVDRTWRVVFARGAAPHELTVLRCEIEPQASAS